jgi:hypothetical protein
VKLVVLLISSIVLSISTISAQQQLNNFNEVFEAFKKGKEVKAVIHYAKCKLTIDGVEEEAPDAVGGMTASTFEYFAPGVVYNEKAFIVFSENLLISHPTRGHVYNYGKIKLYEDDIVEITVKYLEPGTLETVMHEIFTGKINDGTNNEAVFFYGR